MVSICRKKLSHTVRHNDLDQYRDIPSRRAIVFVARSAFAMPSSSLHIDRVNRINTGTPHFSLGIPISVWGSPNRFGESPNRFGDPRTEMGMRVTTIPGPIRESPNRFGDPQTKTGIPESLYQNGDPQSEMGMRVK